MAQESELRFTPSAQQVLLRSREYALARHVYNIGGSDITLAVIEDPFITQLIKGQGHGSERIRARIDRIEVRGDKPTPALNPQHPYTPRAEQILQVAWEETQAEGGYEVSPLHIFKGTIQDSDGVGGGTLRSILGDEALKGLITTTRAAELAYKLKMILENPELLVRDRSSLFHNIEVLLDAAMPKNGKDVLGYKSLLESRAFQHARTRP